MRDPRRIHEICVALEEAWARSPDQRMGQFIENYVFPSMVLGGRGVCVPFFQEDDETLRILRELSK